MTKHNHGGLAAGEIINLLKWHEFLTQTTDCLSAVQHVLLKLLCWLQWVQVCGAMCGVWLAHVILAYRTLHDFSLSAPLNSDKHLQSIYLKWLSFNSVSHWPVLWCCDWRAWLPIYIRYSCSRTSDHTVEWQHEGWWHRASTERSGMFPSTGRGGWAVHGDWLGLFGLEKRKGSLAATVAV